MLNEVAVRICDSDVKHFNSAMLNRSLPFLHVVSNATVDLLASARDSPDESRSLISDMDNLEKAIIKVQEMLERVLEHVNGVVVGNAFIWIFICWQLMNLKAFPLCQDGD